MSTQHIADGRPDERARFVELLFAHQGVVRRVASLYARDAADREDLTQEIALQAWRAFARFRGDAAFSTFLYRVALNTALMRVRRKYRAPNFEPPVALESLAAPARAAIDEDVERLYAAIRELAPLDRAIVMLVLDERSHAEIADVTGLTVGNVSVRLMRAKQRLRDRLGAQPGAGGAGKEEPSCSTQT
jgi:RNA polymerase sigma-70 factor (ECF subfamily)